MTTTIERTHAFDEARKAGRQPFKVKDLSLAEFGRKEIRLAEQEMPGLMAVRARYAAKKPLAGMQVMGSLHMTIQTVVFFETLAEFAAVVGWGRCIFFSPKITLGAGVLVAVRERTERRRILAVFRSLRGKVRASRNTGGVRQKPYAGRITPGLCRSSTTVAMPHCSFTRRWNSKASAKFPHSTRPMIRKNGE